jgi:hypothetical protein
VSDVYAFIDAEYPNRGNAVEIAQMCAWMRVFRRTARPGRPGCVAVPAGLRGRSDRSVQCLSQPFRDLAGRRGRAVRKRCDQLGRSRPASGVIGLTVGHTSLGTVLTNSQGFTLYAFEADKGTPDTTTP